MRTRPACVVGLLLLVAGCFAVELDVNKEGKLLVTRQEGFFLVDPVSKEVKLIQKAEGSGAPSYARFSPNGKQILTVVKSDFQTFVFSLVDIASGQGTKLFSIDNAANARFSPDGAFLAVIAGSKEDDPKFQSKVPELHLVPTGGGKPKVIVRKIGVHVRWLPDSKTIVLLEAKSKVKDNSFSGTVSTLDVTTGKLTPKAGVVCNQQFAFDVSPDGKRAVFTAYAAGKAGAKLDGAQQEFPSENLYQVNLSTGETKNLEIQPKYAFYSPNGKSLLLGMPPDGFRFDSVKLQVASADNVTETMDLGEAAFPLALGGEGTVYAGWITDQSVYYSVEKKVYGTTAKSMQLLTVSIDGSERRLLQPAIDNAAFE